MDFAVNPTVGQAFDIVKQAVSQRRTVIMVGSCSVNYLGRAKSKLESGERVLILKSDGSLLVHRNVGYEPVNWMPGGDTVCNVEANDGQLHIRVLRHRPLEKVIASFSSLAFVSGFVLRDSGEFSLFASEEDMQRAILSRPELVEKGFKPISFEKKIEPGFVDICGEDKDGTLAVIEIKRKTAGKDAAFQLVKYIEAMKNIVNREVRGILVAPNIGKGVHRTLETLGLEYKHLDPKKCADVLSKIETKKLLEYSEH